MVKIKVYAVVKEEMRNGSFSTIHLKPLESEKKEAIKRLDEREEEYCENHEDYHNETVVERRTPTDLKLNAKTFSVRERALRITGSLLREKLQPD